MKLHITVVAGDGIGPEVTAEALRTLGTVAEHGDHQFTYTHALIGGAAIDALGTPLPQQTLDAALASDAVFLGAVGSNKFNHLAPSERPEAGLLAIRAALGGFANLRPAFAHPALAHNSPLRAEVIEGADILFVRELLGGLYFGQPRAWDRASNEAWNTMRYTREEIMRVARIGFELASAAASSPRSTRRTCSRSRNSGAPPSTRLPGSSRKSPSNTSLSTPVPCT